MSATQKTEQATRSSEGTGHSETPDPQTIYVAPPRRSGIARFFSNLLLLTISLGAAFGGGYFVMDQEAQMAREAWRLEQNSAQDRIAALEEQINQLQDNNARSNQVALDLTDIFAPIKSAVSRLAEAQVELVAQQISAEVVRIVETDVQSMTGLTSSISLASIADAVGTAVEPAIAEFPRTSAGEPEDRETPAPEPEPDDLIEPTALDLAPTATERSGPTEDAPLDTGTPESGPVAELPTSGFTGESIDSRTSTIQPETVQGAAPSTAKEQLSHGMPRLPTDTLLGRLADFTRVKHTQVQESVASALREAISKWRDHLGSQTRQLLGPENRAPAGAINR